MRWSVVLDRFLFLLFLFLSSTSEPFSFPHSIICTNVESAIEVSLSFNSISSLIPLMPVSFFSFFSFFRKISSLKTCWSTTSVTWRSMTLAWPVSLWRMARRGSSESSVVHRLILPQRYFALLAFFLVCLWLTWSSLQLQQESYDAEPIDVWSCGIILSVLMTGGWCRFFFKIFIHDFRN